MRSSDEQIALLNRYYFDEFVPRLPVPLRHLATNPYVLYHRGVEGAFTEVIRYVMDEYWIMPWMLADLFSMDDEYVLAVNRAYLLLFLSYLVQDHLADGQTPELPLIPLFARHLHLCATEQFRQLVGDHAAFWELYYDSARAHTIALSLEHQSVAQHVPPLDMARMREIAAGKAMPFHVAAAAMASPSQREAMLQQLRHIFDLYLLADQLYDDVQDYEEDWQERRATIVFVMLAQAENHQPLHSLFEDHDLNAITEKLMAHSIQEKLLTQSSDLFREALDALPIQAQGTRLQGLLEKRLVWNKQRLNACKGVRLFRRLRNALEL